MLSSFAMYRVGNHWNSYEGLSKYRLPLPISHDSEVGCASAGIPAFAGTAQKCSRPAQRKLMEAFFFKKKKTNISNEFQPKTRFWCRLVSVFRSVTHSMLSESMASRDSIHVVLHPRILLVIPS